MEGEGGVGVVGVANSHIVDGLRVLQPLLHRVVGQPDLVPLVDAVEVRGVVEAHVALGDGTQVLHTQLLSTCHAG